MKQFIIFILLFISLFAKEAEEFSFVGIGVSGQNIELSNSKSDKTTVALKYGKQSIDYRTTFAFDYEDNYQSLSMSLDKILVDTFFGTPKIRPYLGLGVGTLKYKDTTLSDDSGYYYGGIGGFIVYVTDNIDMDISYHYNIVQEIKRLDNIQGLSFAMHYFF
ncbi:MAG: hypothetical protein QM493_04695 [Sulfurovum sp.]